MGVQVTKVKNAIMQAVEVAGSQTKLANQLGISQKNVSRWLSGQVDTIHDAIWEKIFPHIANYLSEEQKRQLQTQSPKVLHVEQDGLSIEMLKVWHDLDFDDRLDALKYMSRLKQEKKSVLKSS